MESVIQQQKIEENNIDKKKKTLKINLKMEIIKRIKNKLIFLNTFSKL